jgi:hypothetical protein
MRNIPPLFFDSSGSAMARFFGKLGMIEVHWAEAKVPSLKMICPNSILKEKTCLVCKNDSGKKNSHDRLISLAWDCKKNRWSLYLSSHLVFNEIFQQCNKVGVSNQLIENGDGPDVLIQRMGYKNEVAVLIETIAKTRGKDKPDFDEVLKSAAKKSYWNKFDSTITLEQKYPKVKVV